MPKALTQMVVERSRPHPTKRLEVPDGLLPGLYLVIQPQPSGRKSFAVRFRVDRKPVKVTLGSHPALTLAEARRLARDTLLAAKQGRNPIAERKEASRRATVAARDTLQAIAETYLRRRKAEGLRSADQLRAIFERAVFPALGRRPIVDIKPKDIVGLLDELAEERGPRAADSALVALSTFFKWHSSRDEDFKSPMRTGWQRVNAKARRRERVLTDDELRVVWRVAEASNGPFARLVQFLLLTAARRNEAAQMSWDELQGEDWVLAGVRHKAGEDVGPLVRPLSRAAIDLLARIPRIGSSGFVFTLNGVVPIADFGGFKERFDLAVLEELRKQDREAQPLAHWVIHDLRRTARSLMSRAGVAVDVAERCLGHALPGIRATYDRYEYHREKALAYEALASLIERIVSGPVDNNVVQLTSPRK